MGPWTLARVVMSDEWWWWVMMMMMMMMMATLKLPSDDTPISGRSLSKGFCIPSSYCWWTKLRQISWGWSFVPIFLRGFIHLSWCMKSPINSMSVTGYTHTYIYICILYIYMYGFPEDYSEHKHETESTTTTTTTTTQGCITLWYEISKRYKTLVEGQFCSIILCTSSIPCSHKVPAYSWWTK